MERGRGGSVGGWESEVERRDENMERKAEARDYSHNK